jgi:uncharacterized protein YggE
VTGEGSASAAADVVQVNLGIRCDSDTVTDALAQAAATIRAVSEAARGHRLADRDLSTTSASVQPRWDPQGQLVVGYTAYHQLALTVRRLGDLGDLVDAVAQAAGNRLVIDGITLEWADRAPLRTRAREAAFADAAGKAGQYAALAGARLGAVREVLELGSGDGAGGYGGGPMRAMSLTADKAGLPVEAGEQTVTVTVQVAWELVAD